MLLVCYCKMTPLSGHIFYIQIHSITSPLSHEVLRVTNYKVFVDSLKEQ